MKWIPIISLCLAVVATGLGGGGIFSWCQYRHDVKRETVRDYWSSFTEQIKSAETREDKSDVERLRLQYEREQEAWRAQQNLQIVAPREVGRGTAALSKEEIDHLRELLAQSASLPLAVTSAEGSLLRGNSYFKTGQYDLAIREYSQSLVLNPTNSEAYHSRAAAYNELGQYERAIEDLDEAIRLDPQNAVAYSNRGFSYEELGQHERAIEDYDEAIRLDPQYAVAYNHRGFSYEELGQHERAIEDYDEAIRLDPQHATAYANRAIAFTSLGMGV